MTLHQHQQITTIAVDYKNRLSMDHALMLNQSVFNSLCRQRWLDWDVDKETFRVNEEGLYIWRVNKEWNTFRQNHNNPLGIYAQRQITARKRRGFKLIHRAA